jgi:hypothetical protein
MFIPQVYRSAAASCDILQMNLSGVWTLVQDRELRERCHLATSGSPAFSLFDSVAGPFCKRLRLKKFHSPFKT